MKQGSSEIPFTHSISVDSNDSQNSQSSQAKLCRDHPDMPFDYRQQSYPNGYVTTTARTPCMTRAVLMVNCIILVLLLVLCTALFMHYWSEIRILKEDIEELRKVIKDSACVCPTPSTGQGQRERDNDNTTPKVGQAPINNSTYNFEGKFKEIAGAEISVAIDKQNEYLKQKISFAQMGGSGGTAGNNDQFGHFHSWDTKGDSDEHFSNQRVRISSHQKCFHINATGWYYIYNQVFLQKRDEFKISNETVSHEVIRKRDLEIKQLMFSVSPAFCDQTQYNGGIFHVKHGDYICLKLDNNLKINADPRYSYFGLFMLAMPP